MREIKFRAWIKTDIEDDGIYEYMESDASTFIDPFELHNSEKIILMQYTGLKDKNGVEIYEGDYVVMTATSPIGINIAGVVKSDDGCWVIESKKSQAYLYNNFSEIKVVDNIYENPELINQ